MFNTIVQIVRALPDRFTTFVVEHRYRITIGIQDQITVLVHRILRSAVRGLRGGREATHRNVLQLLRRAEHTQREEYRFARPSNRADFTLERRVDVGNIQAAVWIINDRLYPFFHHQDVLAVNGGRRDVGGPGDQLRGRDFTLDRDVGVDRRGHVALVGDRVGVVVVGEA